MQQIITRILALSIVLSIATPTLVRAQASGTASPSQAQAGQRVNFSASGFQPGETVNLWITYPDSGVQPRYPEGRADNNGALLWSWDVPANAPDGNYSAAGRGNRSGSSVNIPFRVTGSVPNEASVTPLRGGPGTTFTFTATGFQPDEKASAWVTDPSGRDRDIAAEYDPNFGADSSGRLTWSYTVPADVPSGEWKGRAKGNSSLYQVAISFTVEATAPPNANGSISPTSGAPGTIFSVRVSGLQANEEVGTWLNQPNGRQLDATPVLRADAGGVATWSWASPTDAQAGRWQAVSTGRSSGRQVVLDFTLTGNNPPASAPTVSGTISPSSGVPGTVFNVNAQGFYPGETVFYWPTGPDGVPLDGREKLTADAEGKVSFSWQSPRLMNAGEWQLNLEGQSSRRDGRIPFTIIAPENGPAITVTPSSGGPGTVFSFRATGYNDIEFVYTWLEDPNRTRIDGPQDQRADRYGVVEWQWTAPADAVGGQWTMFVRGENNKRLLQSIPFTIVRDTAPAGPPASVSPASGSPGTTFTFKAGGYKRDERVGYWLNTPDGSIVRFDRELTADREGFVTVAWTAPANALRGSYTMAFRSSNSDRIPNDVSHQIGFVVQ
jgi:hypothetical protein